MDQRTIVRCRHVWNANKGVTKIRIRFCGCLLVAFDRRNVKRVGHSHYHLQSYLTASCLNMSFLFFPVFDSEFLQDQRQITRQHKKSN